MRTRLDNPFARWVGAVARVRWLVVLLTLALTAAALVYTVEHIRITTDAKDMLSEELPFRQAYDQYKRKFPQYVHTLLIVVEGPTPEAVRNAADRLAQKLKQEDSQFQSVYVPNAGSFFERNALLYLPTPELEDLADNLAQVQPFLARLTADQSLRGLTTMISEALEAVRDGESIDLAPMLMRLNTAVAANLADRPYQLSWQKMMFGGDSAGGVDRQFVLAQARLDYGRWLPGEPAMQRTRDLIREVESGAPGALDIRLTGSVALNNEELQSVTRGAGLTAALALVMVLVVLLLGLRSPRLVAAAGLSLVVGLVLTAGFATLAVGQLNMISVAFAVLYIGLGIDFAIHLCLRYQTDRQQGDASSTALRRSGGDVGGSLLLCAITTAIGFYAFIPTAFTGVSELGLIAGTGMFISLVISLTFLPALLALSPPQRTHRLPMRFLAAPEAVLQFPYRHATAVRRGALVVAVLALGALAFVRFDYNPLDLKDPHSESVQTFRELLANSDTPPWNATVLADNASQAERYSEQLRARKAVGKVISVQDFVPSNQQDKLAVIDDMAFILGPQLTSGGTAPPSYAQQVEALRHFRQQLSEYLQDDASLPWSAMVRELRTNLGRLLTTLTGQDAADAAERLQRLENSLLKTLPQSLKRLSSALQAQPVAFSDLPKELVDRWVAADGTRRIQVSPADDISHSLALKRFVNQVQAVAPDATDLPVLSLESGQAVVKSFQQAFIGALVVITLLLLIILRSVVDALMVLTPLLFGGLLTAAVATLIGIDFNFANIIALPLLLGIGVDNGIHMMRRIRRRDAQAAGLLQTSTARAVLFSALTTMAGFGNLGFSPHPGTASMGVLLTVGVLLTLLSTLTVFPALAEWRARHGPSHGSVNG